MFGNHPQLGRLKNENADLEEIRQREAKKLAYQEELRIQMEEAKQKKEDEKRQIKLQEEQDELRFLKEREKIDQQHKEELEIARKKKEDEDNKTRANNDKLVEARKLAEEDKKNALSKAIDRKKPVIDIPQYSPPPRVNPAEDNPKGFPANRGAMRNSIRESQEAINMLKTNKAWMNTDVSKQYAKREGKSLVASKGQEGKDYSTSSTPQNNLNKTPPQQPSN